MANRRLNPAQLAALHERAAAAHKVLPSTCDTAERWALLAAVVWPSPGVEEAQIELAAEREAERELAGTAA